MRCPRIYTEQTLQANGSIQLESRASQHVARVLRMQVGEPLVLFNGGGGQYRATISAANKKAVVVTTGDHAAIEVESRLRLQLGIAISRGERMDWIVQKATELGVCSISPLFSERTEVRLKGERADKKLRHWQQVAISACEQCGRNRLPVIQPLQSLNQWVSEARADTRLVLHHRAGPPDTSPAAPASAALLVGPEGGLTSTEIASAEQAGFRPLQLGPRVLRTETAPLAAIAILQARWGDMAAG
jgi:16S rRNA (uracil1498-N3)-methyltransferase